MVSIDTMNTQINLRLPDTLLSTARTYADEHGFGTVQEFIKETVRQKLFEDEGLTAEESELVKIIYQESEERNDYGTKEELFAILRAE